MGSTLFATAILLADASFPSQLWEMLAKKAKALLSKLRIEIMERIQAENKGTQAPPGDFAGSGAPQEGEHAPFATI